MSVPVSTAESTVPTVGFATVAELLSRRGPLKWSGRVTFPARELAGWEWPLTVFRGPKDGPSATVIGGTHGAEYVGMLAVRRLAAALKPEAVKGTLYLLPVLDLPSFWGKTPFVCPVDGKDPAVCFPGNPKGTFTEVMDYHIWRSFFEPSEAILDLHGGDICEDLIPFTIMQTSGDPQLDARTEMACRAFELPFLVVRPLQPPTGIRKHLAVGAERGKVALVAEIGGAGNASPNEVTQMHDGLVRSLGYLGVLKELPFNKDATKNCRVTSVTASRDGVFTPFVRVGSEVEEGQRLGRLDDLAGAWSEDLVAPSGGTVLFMNRVPAAPKGTTMFGIGFTGA